MGHARFDATAYAMYSTATTVNAKTGMRLATHEVFTQRNIHKDLDPKLINVRESCDSELNPNSRAIMLGLDVTGSMGHIANDIANHELGVLMNKLIDEQTVADPHIMFMGIGDSHCDRAPFQASQFEADIRIAQQLSQMFIESGGGGNNFESYTIPWWFAAFKTKIDCFEKRGKKGLLFTMGDEMPPPDISANEIYNVFGNKIQQGFPTKELYDIVRQKWDVFHVIVEQGSYARSRGRAVYDAWYEIMGNRVIRLTDYTKLATVICAVINVNEGMTPEAVIENDPENRKLLEAALYGYGHN